jgi:hypothetical protein
VGNPVCCLKSVEKWYKSFLVASGGRHSEGLTKYFLDSNSDLAPLFANLLGTGIEFRVAASKGVGQARMQPLVCPACGAHIALVILSLPLMLLIFRLQGIFISMIESWEIIPEGPKKFRERIEVKDADNAQVQQLELALEMYLGNKDVTFEGMPDLLQGIFLGSKEAKATFLDAIRVAESWIVAHEVFHVILASDAEGPFSHYAIVAESQKDPRAAASHFSAQVSQAFHLNQSISEQWCEEFQADLMASRFLLIAIADRRYNENDRVPLDTSDARLNAARVVANGVAAALEAIYWVDIQKGTLATNEEARASSHPPHHVRWCLIENYIKAIINVDGDSFANITNVLAALSRSLFAAYQRRNAERSAVKLPQ